MQDRSISAIIVVCDVDPDILASVFLRGHNAVWNHSSAKKTFDGCIFDMCGRPKTGFVRSICVQTDIWMHVRHHVNAPSTAKLPDLREVHPAWLVHNRVVTDAVTLTADTER